MILDNKYIKSDNNYMDQDEKQTKWGKDVEEAAEKAKHVLEAIEKRQQEYELQSLTKKISTPRY